MKRLVLALLATAAFAAPANAADLKYTLHMEAKAAANAPSDPMAQMVASMLTQSVPPGGVDQLVISSDKGMRSEQKQDAGPMKAGMVLLVKADGTQYVLDSAAKTYYKVPSLAAADMAALMGTPKVTLGKPGVFETIDGMKCERVTLNVSLTPPGMPMEFAVVVDMWLADSLKTSAAGGSASMAMLRQFGVDQLPELKKVATDGRLPVKTVVSMFGVDLITTAKDIKTEAADPALFEIPKDYKEVPPPGIGGAPAPARF
jgi:hypothetical protein